MQLKRRSFMGLSAAALAALTIGGYTLSHHGDQPLLLSARNGEDGQHYAVGYWLNGEKAFAIAVPERCHDVVAHPTLPLALFVGRRPSTASYLVDTRKGHLLQTLESSDSRHFYGHAVFHKDGQWLYATENDTRDPGRGVLGVYQLESERLVRQKELSTHGIGPHQLLWMPDGETLVVANGGIRTEADSRVEMNLNAMQPSLVLMSRDGRLHSKENLPEPMNSIRHLAIAKDGTIVSAQQYMGDSADSVPLLAIKRPNQALQYFPVAAAQLQVMKQYTASVAVHSELRLLAMTAPRGNRLFIWNLDDATVRLDTALPDCAGVAALPEGFVVSAGIGRCRLYDCRQQQVRMQPLNLPAGLWDNHLKLL
jgi:hypothetical protein